MADINGDAESQKLLKDLSQIQLTRDERRFSDLELQVLQLYDQLEEARMERALLEAGEAEEQQQQQTGRRGNGKVQDQEVARAEDDALEARAVYALSKHAVEDVVTAEPILKAVHSAAAEDASELDAELRYLVGQRDVLSMIEGNYSSEALGLHRELVRTQVDAIAQVEQNRELAGQVLALSKSLEQVAPHGEAGADEELRERAREAKKILAANRQSHRVIKSILAAIIASSGIDWASDENLRDLVLDEDGST